jgi:hypothetical protein
MMEWTKDVIHMGNLRTAYNISDFIQRNRGNKTPIRSRHKQRLATGWTVLRPNPEGDDIFRTRPDGLGTRTVSYTMGTGSLSLG